MVPREGIEPPTRCLEGIFNFPNIEAKTPDLLVFYRRILDASNIFEAF